MGRRIWHHPRARMPANVLFVAPYYGANILQCLDALASMSDVRLGIITHESEANLPERYRGRVVGHYQVRDCLDAEQLTAAGKAFQAGWGRVDRLIGFLEQMQIPLAVARDRLGIPGMGEAVARNFREKNRMKARLREAGLPVAKQTLPSGIDDWRLARRTSSGTGSTAYVYGRPSDAAARLVATLTAVPLTSEALAVALPDQHTIGPATCGVLAGATASACYVPLSGGSLMVTGTPDLDALAALAGRLYDGLR